MLFLITYCSSACCLQTGNVCCCRFGIVLSVRLLPDKFCAFINFRDKSAPGPAMKHLQGKEVGGERLLIRYPNNPVPEQIVLKKPVPTG